MPPDMPGMQGFGALDAVARAGQGPGGPPAGPAKNPGAGDVDRFRAALEGPPRDGAPPGPSAPPGPEAAAGAPAPPAEGGGAGDRILAALSGTSQKIQEGRAAAVRALGAENVSQADLLRANFALIESSTLVSAVSKVAEKVTQGIKNLQQG